MAPPIAFRSRPIARISVLAGRTVPDLMRDVFAVTPMMIVGLVPGVRASARDLVQATAWIVGMLVSVPLAVALYRRAAQ